MSETWTSYCNYMIEPPDVYGGIPPRYCDEQTVEGSDFCERHLDEE